MWFMSNDVVGWFVVVSAHRTPGGSWKTSRDPARFFPDFFMGSKKTDLSPGFTPRMPRAAGIVDPRLARPGPGDHPGQGPDVARCHPSITNHPNQPNNPLTAGPRTLYSNRLF